MKILCTAIINNNKGTIYIFLLIAITIIAITYRSIFEIIYTKTMREKEAYLIYIGDRFRAGLKEYYEWHGLNQYPSSLDNLILDKRPLKPVSHWRKVYYDPITSSKDWGIVKIHDRIAGIYSKSKMPPIKKSNFSEEDSSFTQAKSYQDWKFTYPKDMKLLPRATGND